MSIENLSDSEIAILEAQIGAKNNEVEPSFQHYGSVENLSDSEIATLEAQIRAKNNEVKPSFQHYGSVENLSDNEIATLEAQIRAKNNEVEPSFQHYGSVENLSDNEIAILEAQVQEKRNQDIPYKEYLNNLIDNPIISDKQQFESAVIRSMESNELMKNFTSSLINKISEAVYEFKMIEKTDAISINSQKRKLENLVNLYVRYLYELKNHGWTFYGLSNDIGLAMINGDILENLWQVQKQFGFSFNMLIPKNLGEYYGQAFEREGKMVPAISLMYDDLKDKEVNWHQVLIYKENELTPKQRYLQKTVKQFDLARQEEIKNALAYAHSQTQINNIGMENQEQLDATSIGR